MATRTPPKAEQTSADLAAFTPPWRQSDELEAVARQLIRRYPTQFGFIDRHSFRIAYLLRTDGPPSEAKIDAVAKCVKASGPIGFLAGVEFVIWANEWYWSNFPQHHEAIVLHELLHVGVTDKGRPALYKHDVEEFIGVAATYGAWELNRKRFHEALTRHDNPSTLDLASEQIAEAVVAVAGEAASREPDGTVVIDATKLDELRNRAKKAREGGDE